MPKSKIYYFTGCLLFLFGFFTKNLSAQQNNKLDSLRQVYSVQPDDTTKFHTLILLFNAYLYNNPPEAKKYALEKLALSKKLNSEKDLAKSYYLMGAWHYNANHPDTAKTYYKKALLLYSELIQPKGIIAVSHELASVEYAFGNYNSALQQIDENLDFLKKHVNDSLDLVLAYLLKGTVNNQKGHYDLALTDLLRGLEILNTLDEPIRLADALNLLGAVEFNLKNFKKSIEYNQQALKVYRDQNDKYFEAQALNDIGNTNYYMKDYELAIKNLKNSLVISKELNILTLQATTLNNLGKSYIALNRLSEAFIHFEKGLQMAEKSKEKNKITESLNDYSAALLLVDPQKAIENLNRAIALADSTNSVANMSTAYQIRSEAYTKLNKTVEALGDYKQHTKLKDSIFNVAKSQQIEQLRTIYDTTKKEQQIAMHVTEIDLLEEKEKNSTLQKWWLGSGLGLSLLLFGLGFYGIKQKMKRSQVEKEALYNELSFKKKELTTHALHLAKKNETLEGLKQKAVALKKESQDKKNIQELINTINFDLKHDNSWEHFNKYFEEVHKDFGKKIVQQFPDISYGELRLIALIKMNLTSKEIANILNISSDGVKKARQRLRKKMNLDADESLESIILAF